MVAFAKPDSVVWPRFFSATALFATSAGSVALVLAAGAWIRNSEGFFTGNEVSDFVRARMLIAMMLGAGSALAIAFLAVLFGRGGGARGIESVARMAAPLALLWALQVLGSYRIWRAHPLEFLILLAVTVLVLERALRSSLAALPLYPFQRIGELYDRLPVLLRRALPWLIVIAAASGYAAFTGYWSIMQHWRLATGGYDLGIYDNLMYNTLDGTPFRSPVLYGSGGGNYIASHAEFVTLLFVPIYALAPRAETLLVFQSLMLGFAALPLYAFAKTQIPRWSALLVSLAYLLYAPLHGANFYEFHWLSISVFFVFCLFWAIAQRRNVLTWIFFFVLLSVREDISVGLALLGTFLAVSGTRLVLGLAMLGLAATSFVLIKFVIMPAAGTWWFANMYKELIPSGKDGYGHVIQTILINPAYFLKTLLEKGKLTYALHLLAPLVFLPARRFILLLGASGGFFFTLMTTDYGPTVDIAFQYSSHWIPYLFGASVLALRWLGQDEVLGLVKRRAALGALGVGVGLHSLTFGAILQRSNFIGGFSQIPFAITNAERARHAELKSVAALIPRDASVAATDTETPHVSNRSTIYTLNVDAGDADYILIRPEGLGRSDARANLQRALDRNSYRLVKKTANFSLLQRAKSSPETAALLKSLGFSLADDK